MTLHPRFFLFLLLISFPQPWKLAASTPGAEDFFKYVAEEGTLLVDEAIGEEDFINHHLPLNTEQSTAQTVIHTTEERASPEISSIDTHSITYSTSSSTFHEAPETTATVEQPVGSLDDIPMAHPIPTSKIILFTQIDTINNNIEKLEKAAEAVIQLSKQRNRCLASAAAATAAGNIKTEKLFQAAVIATEEAITSYNQFGQKMKEGDVLEASLLRIKGFSLACCALEKEYRAHAALSEDSAEAKSFSEIFTNASSIASSLQRAAQTKSQGYTEATKAYEQATQYHFQAAQATTNGDSTKAENFSTASYNTYWTGRALEKVGQTRNEGQIEAAKAYEQTAQFFFHAIQAAVQGNRAEVKSFSSAAHNAHSAAESLENAAQAKNKGNIEVAKAYEQAAQYQLQAAQAANNRNNTKVENFSRAVINVCSTVQLLENAARARGENSIEVAKAYEQAAQYQFQAAQSATNGNSTEIENFSTASLDAGWAAFLLERAAQLKSENDVQTKQGHEQNAYYHLRRAEIHAQNGKKKGGAFSRQVYDEELQQRERKKKNLYSEKCMIS